MFFASNHPFIKGVCLPLLVKCRNCLQFCGTRCPILWSSSTPSVCPSVLYLLDPFSLPSTSCILASIYSLVFLYVPLNIHLPCMRVYGWLQHECCHLTSNFFPILICVLSSLICDFSSRGRNGYITRVHENGNACMVKWSATENECGWYRAGAYGTYHLKLHEMVTVCAIVMS